MTIPQSVHTPSLAKSTFDVFFQSFKIKPVLAHFFGTIHKSIAYSNGVRQKLYEMYDIRKIDKNFYFMTYDNSSNQCKLPGIFSFSKFGRTEITLQDSTFCLCPGGWEPWSARLYSCIEQGSIPVILADQQRLPFHEILDWSKFSVRIPIGDVERIEIILRSFTLKQIVQMRTALMKAAQYLLWNTAPMNVLDLILYEAHMNSFNMIHKSVQ